MKTCNKCGNTKPIDQFSKDRTKVDGLRTQCKECKKQVDLAYQSERRDVYSKNAQRWRRDNADRHREYMRNYMRTYVARAS